MRSKWWAAAIRTSVLGLALVLVSVRAAAADRVSLQLKWYHQFQFAGYYAAQLQGFYEEQGLDVEIIEGDRGRPPHETVMAGRATFGVQDGGDALYRRLQGAPVVLVAAVFQHSPYVIISRRDAGIRRPVDLIGREVMLTQEQGSEQLLSLFRREGIDYRGDDPGRSIRIIPHSRRLEDLAEGRVAAMSAYSTDAPFRLREMGMDFSVLRPIEYGIDFYGDVLFTREAVASEHPDMVHRFRAASMRGWEYAMAHHQELVDAILQMPSARAARPSREALLAEAEAMQDIIVPDLVQMGHVNPGRWERMAREYKLLGLVSDTRGLDGFVFDPDQEKARTRRILSMVAYIGAGLGLLALLSLIWVTQLRRRVAERTAALEREVRLRELKSHDLEASEQKNRAIVSALPDLVFIQDRRGAFVDYQARSTADLAIPPEEFLGKKPSEVLPADLARRFESMLQEVLRTRQMRTLEYALPVGGKQGLFEARMVSCGPDRALTLVRDMTEERHVRDRLAELAIVVDQAADDIIITNPDGTIRYVNPAFERTTGYCSTELVGNTPTMLQSGKHDETFYREFWKVLKRTGAWQGRFINRAKDGHLLHQDATVVAIHDGDGRLAGYASIARDVTAQLQLETQLAQAQRMDAIGTLAGGIAHDFNNILAAIMGYSDLAKHLLKRHDEGRVNDCLQNVLHACGRASDLVRQILAFSRRSQHEVKRIAVGPVIKDALKFLRATIPSSIDIVQHIDSESFLLADAGDVQRILVNLCANAALAISGPGQIEVRLQDTCLDTETIKGTSRLASGRYVMLTVRDTGCGMNDDVQSRIFEPFFTTRPAGQGTGLGLSVVHGIVKSRGGAIEVQSVLGTGTTFCVLLPAAEPASSVRQAKEPTASPGRGTILLVEDEPMIAESMSALLEDLGYNVALFTNSVDALTAFVDHPQDSDAVVTDFTMPNMGGDALARRIKEVRPEIPVVLCSGNDTAVPPNLVQEGVIDALLQKPYTVSELSSVLSAVRSVRG